MQLKYSVLQYCIIPYSITVRPGTHDTGKSNWCKVNGLVRLGILVGKYVTFVKSVYLKCDGQGQVGWAE